jgi:phosphoribosylaminoimidazole (AIR) synthetase
MFRTLNMGIGLVLIVPREQALFVVESLTRAGENAAVIGEIVRGSHEVQVV